MPEEQKLFYTIGEVAQTVNVKPYVLRYWETEFKKLDPQKSQTGQRTYRKRDIEIALTIKRLLYDEKYTIAGAVQKLEELEKEGLDQIDMFAVKAAEEAAIEKAKAALPKFEMALEENSKNEQVEHSPSPISSEKADEFLGLIEASKAIFEKYGLA